MSTRLRYRYMSESYRAPETVGLLLESLQKLMVSGK